jgi:hypothetical protein
MLCFRIRPGFCSCMGSTLPLQMHRHLPYNQFRVCTDSGKVTQQATWQRWKRGWPGHSLLSIINHFLKLCDGSKRQL